VPWSALPHHLNDPHEIEASFPDDSDYGFLIRRLKKATKHWFAFGPRATEWWAKWRTHPIILFALFGRGSSRWETSQLETGFHLSLRNPAQTILLCDPSAAKVYLSRVQYWTRWHVSLQWPLMLTFHVYWRETDVPSYPSKPQAMNVSRMLFVYFGHRDADDVYWPISAYVGGKWK
jgi:hypothetical protein